MKNILTLFQIKEVLAILVIACISGCSSNPANTVSFYVYVGGEPLKYGKDYPSPNGDGTYSINDFKFFISNISLTGGEAPQAAVYKEEESYHLLTFQESNHFSFSLKDVPDVPFEKIRFSVGVDEAANTSLESPGDLDPTGQMAWNWTQGYKFILLEGEYKSDTSDYVIPLVYHIGFSENTVELAFDRSPKGNDRFSIEINELFKNPNPVDFHKMPKILFNETHAALISQNYANDFISPD